MPKKSSGARQPQARRAQTPQSPSRSQNVALVRATKPDAAIADNSTPATTPKASTTASSAPRNTGRTATASRPATAAKSAAKSAATRPTTARPAPQSSHAVREQEKKVARAKEMRRVRAANVVTPEHYRYVIRDLRMTGILAAAMFAVIVVLHFVLG